MKSRKCRNVQIAEEYFQLVMKQRVKCPNAQLIFSGFEYAWLTSKPLLWKEGVENDLQISLSLEEKLKSPVSFVKRFKSSAMCITVVK